MAKRQPVLNDYQNRVAWFHQARFGMFIHWGLYSLLERGEWVMFTERMPAAEYAPLAKRFNPRRFDAGAWANLAAEAGAKYVVLTARHHDGFCLWDSRASEFTSTKTRARRDFVAEYVEAVRRAGLKVGLYYSLVDWRFPGCHEPLKYPDSAQAMYAQYRAQVRELLTGYGRIDILWYDAPGIHSPAAWGSRGVLAAARRLQPGILVNDRSGIRADIDTCENVIRASRPGRAWEACLMMINRGGWGYIRHTSDFRTPTQLELSLVLAAGGEGNLLLNIGPRPDGTVRPEERSRLLELGRWLRRNGEGIHGSERCALADGNFGKWTRRGKVGYFHIFKWPGRVATIPLVKSRALRATLLGPGCELGIAYRSGGRLTLTGLPAQPPAPGLNSIRIEFDEVPLALPERDRAAWLRGDLAGEGGV